MTSIEFAAKRASWLASTCSLVEAVIGEVVEGNLVESGQLSRRFVVADDEREIAVQLSGLVAVEQVGEAVEIVGDKDGDVLGRGGEGESPVHSELLGQGREGGVEVRFIAIGVVGGELDAHEEEAKLDVLVLVGVEDVGVVLLNQEVGDGGDETFAVGAVDEKNGGLGHGSVID